MNKVCMNVLIWNVLERNALFINHSAKCKFNKKFASVEKGVKFNILTRIYLQQL